MATFTLDDRTGMIPVTIFPRALAAQDHLLTDEGVVILRARLDRREEEPKLISIDLEGFSAETRGALRLHFPAGGVTEDRLRALKRLLDEHGGDSPVEIQGAGPTCWSSRRSTGSTPRGGSCPNCANFWGRCRAGLTAGSCRFALGRTAHWTIGGSTR